MRTVSGGETTVLQARQSAHALRIEIQNASAAWVDYSSYLARDWQDRCEITQDVNQRVAEATVEIARSNELGSLSPLMNTEIATGRLIRISGSRVAIGSGPSFKKLFQGRIDRVDWASDPMRIVARDDSGRLVDRWIEAPDGYGSESGVAIETVMQQILDEWADSFPLYTPVSPGFLITSYNVDPQPVMSALTALADAIGWVVEYRWDNGTGDFRLTFYEPDRTPSGTAFTFGPDDYYTLPRMDEDSVDVRNSITVQYRESSTDTRASVIVEDSASIAKFGRQWAEFVEPDDSPIDTLAEATDLANAALADLKAPVAEQQMETDLFWPVQLGDYYQFNANSVHYGAAQEFGVVGFTHVFENGRAVSRIATRGKPVGHVQGWLQREGDLDDDAEPSRVLSIVSLQGSADPSGAGVLIVTVSPAAQLFYVAARVGINPTDAEILQGVAVETLTLERTHTVRVGRGDEGDVIHFGVIAFDLVDATGRRTPTGYAQASVQARPLNAAPTFTLEARKSGGNGFPVAILVGDPDGSMLPYDDDSYVRFTRLDAAGVETIDTPVVVSVPAPEYRWGTPVSLPARWRAEAFYRAKDDDFRTLELGEIEIANSTAAELWTVRPEWSIRQLTDIIVVHDADTHAFKFLARTSAPWPNDDATRALVIATGTLVDPVDNPGTNSFHTHESSVPHPQFGGALHVAAVGLDVSDVPGPLIVASRTRDVVSAGFQITGRSDEERIDAIWEESGEIVTPGPIRYAAGIPRLLFEGSGLYGVRLLFSRVTMLSEDDIDHADTVFIGPTVNGDGSISSRTIFGQAFDIDGDTFHADVFITGWTNGGALFQRAGRMMSIRLNFTDLVLPSHSSRLYVMAWPMGPATPMSNLGNVSPGPARGFILNGDDVLHRIPSSEFADYGGLIADPGTTVVLDSDIASLGLSPGDIVEWALSLQQYDTSVGVTDDQFPILVNLQAVYLDSTGSSLDDFEEEVESSDESEIGIGNQRWIIAVPGHQVPATAFRVRLILDVELLDGDELRLQWWAPRFFLRAGALSGNIAAVVPAVPNIEQAAFVAAQAAASQGQASATQGQTRLSTGAPAQATALTSADGSVLTYNPVTREITEDAIIGSDPDTQRSVPDVNLHISAGQIAEGASVAPLPPPNGIWSPGLTGIGDNGNASAILRNLFRGLWTPFIITQAREITELSIQMNQSEGDPGPGTCTGKIMIATMNEERTEPETIVYVSSAFTLNDNTLETVVGVNFTPTPGVWYAVGFMIITSSNGMDLTNFWNVFRWGDNDTNSHRPIPIAASGGAYDDSAAFITDSEDNYTSVPVAWGGVITAYFGRAYAFWFLMP